MRGVFRSVNRERLDGGFGQQRQESTQQRLRDDRTSRAREQHRVGDLEVHRGRRDVRICDGTFGPNLRNEPGRRDHVVERGEVFVPEHENSVRSGRLSTDRVASGPFKVYVAAHDRIALRRYGPVCCDGGIGVVRCDGDGGIWRVSMVDGSFVEVDGEVIVEAEHACESLELAYEGEMLSVRCHPEVGLTVQVGKARRLVVNGGEARAVSPFRDRVRIFEDWLD